MNKKYLFLLVIALVMVMAWSTSAFAIDWTDNEYPINNTGQTVYDAVKILEGHVRILNAMTTVNSPGHGTFDFYHVWYFGNFTVIKWWGGQVLPGQRASLCFKRPQGQKSTTIAIYFTDEHHNIVSGPVPVGTFGVVAQEGDFLLTIDNDWTHWVGDTIPPAPGDGSGAPVGPIDVGNLQYAVVDEEFTMAELNPDLLIDPGITWTPLGSFPLNPGESEEYNLGALPSGKFVVVAAVIEGMGAETEHLMQFSTTDDIPTLSEWAMIVFAVVIMALMTYVVVRRRRSIQPTTA